MRASKSGSRTQLVRPSPCGHLVAVGPTAQQQHYQQHRQCRLGAAASETSLAGSGDASNAQAQSETEAHPIVGIVIVDHGSKKAEANEMLTQFTQMFKSGGEHQIVEMAHMELAEPSIKQAVHRCVQQGASHIVVAPYFLSRGRHVQNDIPQLAQEAVADLPNVHITVANPIGVHHRGACSMVLCNPVVAWSACAC